MTRALLAVVALLAAACPSAYQRTYDQETARLQAEQNARDQQAAAEHAEASRFAAVVYFEVGSAVVGADGRRELAWFVDKVRPYPDAFVLVQGFADTTGGEAKNQTLSGARARAVADVLAGQGISSQRLVVEGHGTSSPAGPNATPAERARNRRVEVTVR